MLNFFNRKGKSLSKLINMIIQNKTNVIVVLGGKGGISKTTIAYGLSQDYNIPYITNDEGSLFGRRKKFYSNTYLLHDLEFDYTLEDARCLIIDFKGGLPSSFSNEEKILIKLASKVILPTGCDEVLEHTGCIKTAQEVIVLNKKILFVASNIRKENIDKNIESFIKLASRFWKPSSLSILPLTHGGSIVSKSMMSRKSYTEQFEEESDSTEQNDFIKDWKFLSDNLGGIAS